MSASGAFIGNISPHNFNMTPSVATLNITNHVRGHAEPLPYIFQGETGLNSLPYYRNVGIFKRCVVGFFTATGVAQIDHMPAVFFVRNPLKIFNSIILWIAVYMINVVLSFGRFPYKGKGDQAVREVVDSSVTLSVVQHDAQATVVRRVLPHNPSRDRTARLFGAFYSSQIRDGIVRVNRHGQPNFVIKFFGGKVGISHLQKITPFVNRSGLKDYLRNLSACFYFTTPLTGGVR